MAAFFAFFFPKTRANPRSSIAGGFVVVGSSQRLAAAASTHAWAEVYLPTLGWRGLDPTLGDATGVCHIVTGVSTQPRGVMPVSGTFTGAPGDYLGLKVTVKTTVLDDITATV